MALCVPGTASLLKANGTGCWYRGDSGVTWMLDLTSVSVFQVVEGLCFLITAIITKVMAQKFRISYFFFNLKKGFSIHCRSIKSVDFKILDA